MTLPIYIDIDGTLTDAPGKQGGNVIADRNLSDGIPDQQQFVK